MAQTLLTLPTNITWKRLCFSEDMSTLDLNALPAKWHSSVAVFHFEPEPDETDPTPEETTTFLKVVATVTGLQPDAPELAPNLSGLPSWNHEAVGNIAALTQSYYPAYAAIVQVGVAPKGLQENGQPWKLEQYPYFADFEPKKREVVELATDTGEHVTQSRNALNVRKGITNTDSLENVDINHAVSAAAAFQYMGSGGGGGGGGSFSGSANYDKGYRSIQGSTVDNVVTTDASREKRESFSHTASISQLYHVLDSYHLATNRALFFLNARPRMIQSPYTFVNGPRELEGIQEFFLIVKKPAAMKDICVKATLETAHLYLPDQSQASNPNAPPQGQGSLFYHFHLNPKGTTAGSLIEQAEEATDPHPFQIPDGQTIDTSRGGGMINIHFDRTNTDNQFQVPPGMDCKVTRFASGKEIAPQIQQTGENLVQVTVTASGWAGVGDTDGHVEIDFTVYTKLKDPETPASAPQEADLFLTGRAVSNCPMRLTLPDYVTYEKPLSAKSVQLLQTSRGSTPEAVYAANAVSRDIRKQVISSFGRPRRYREGEVDFLTTRFALRAATGNVTRGSADLGRPLARSSAVDKTLRDTIASIAPHLTVGDAISQPPENLASRTGITTAQARVVLKRLLGIVDVGSGPQDPAIS